MYQVEKIICLPFDCYLGNKVGNQLLVQANREVGNVIILIQCIVTVSLSS